MEEIFNELEQFGLKYIKNKNFELNHKYIILDFDFIFSEENKEKNFSNKIKLIDINELKRRRKTFKYKNENIYIFNYAKYLGVYKGLEKVYRKDFNVNIDVDGINSNVNNQKMIKKKKVYKSESASESESESESDSEPEPESELELNVSYMNLNYCEYEISGYVFEKNNEYNIFKLNNNSILFEVDVSFDDLKFLDTIIMVCSNIENEKNRIIKVICLNKEITLKLCHNEFPKKYKKSLNFDEKKQYTIDENFVFFK